MSYSRLKLTAFCFGVLTVCLAASAETPGVDRIGCCGVVAAPQAGVPFAEAEASGSAPARTFIQRGRAHRDWSFHVGAFHSPRVALPPPVDHALQSALGSPTHGATLADWEQGDQGDEVVNQWTFQFVGFPGGYEEPLRRTRRKCHEHESWCHKHGPPTPPPTPAVPEPSTWAMLLVGTAAVGAILRQRRRSASFSGPPVGHG